MDRTCDLGSSPMVPLFVHYALPSIIEQVVSALYNMVVASQEHARPSSSISAPSPSFPFLGRSS